MLNLPSITAHDAEPITTENAAYQSKLVYRADDYSSLRYKLLQHLEEAFPNWNRLLADKQGERDFGVALIEMFSYIADILGFYQNCRANEAFLRTATLPASLIELCALIDYRIPPGASAAAVQAFICKPGTSGKIPSGFKIKTKPQPGAPALVFETSEELDASAGLNELHFKGFDRSEKFLSASGFPAESSALLDQGYAGLKSGQYVVITSPAKYPTAIHLLAATDEDTRRRIGWNPGALTPNQIITTPAKDAIAIQLLAVTDEGTQRRISWKPGALAPNQDLPIADVVILGKPKQQMKLADAERADEIAAGQGSVAVNDPSVIVETAAASLPGMFHLFAHVAPFGTFLSSFYHPLVFVSTGFKQAANFMGLNRNVISWAPPFNIALRRSETSVYCAATLAGSCSDIAPGDQILSTRAELSVGDQVVVSDLTNSVLVRIASASSSSYGLAEPIFQVFPNGGRLFKVDLPNQETGSIGSSFTTVAPVRLSSNTTQLVLDKTYDGLLAGQTVVISDGEFTNVRTLSAVDIDSNQHTVLTLSQAIARDLKVATTTIDGPFELEMRIDGYNRATGKVAAGLTSVKLAGRVQGLAPGRRMILEDADGAEGVRIVTVAFNGNDTDIDLEAPLPRDFSLAATSVLGNVVELTHGQSVIESALGSGDQSQANQDFTLHQKPTTFVHDAEGARGVSNTLQVFVGDEEWQEVESLAESSPNDHHVMVTIDEGQTMSFMGGDGQYGAKFPTDRNNISARYRFGLGEAGNVDPNSITVMAAPLPFLQSSRNPVASNGGADPQDLETTRKLAPVTIRTIDRAVTVEDYQDLALSYAGIAKANAQAVQLDGRPVIDLVVATAGGKPLNSTLRASLTAFLQARSVPNHLILIRSFTPVPVRLSLEAHILPNFLRTETGLRIQKALGSGLAADGSKGYFHLDRRGLGEDLYLSDVYALVEGIEGVDFLIVKQFCAEAKAPAGGEAQDVVKMPSDGIATGGDALDTTVGTLSITLVGGIA